MIRDLDDQNFWSQSHHGYENFPDIVMTTLLKLPEKPFKRQYRERYLRFINQLQFFGKNRQNFTIFHRLLTDFDFHFSENNERNGHDSYVTWISTHDTT